ILPELIPSIGFKQYNPHHDKDVYNHTLCVIDNTPPILSIRLAALFHDIGKPFTFSRDDEGLGHFYGHDKLGVNIANKVLKRFKCPKALIEEVSILVKEHMTYHNSFSDKGIKRLIRRVGEKNIFNLFSLQKSDRKCSNINASFYDIIKLEEKVIKALYKEEAFDVNHLEINGNDLINLGYKEGKIIGDILEYLLDVVMEYPSKNKKEILKKIVVDKYIIP